MRERSADSSGVHVWLVLMKAHRSLVRHAERSIVALDMCISDFGVLEVLLHKGPQSVSEIGRRVELTSGSITTALDRLAEKTGHHGRPSAHGRRQRIMTIRTVHHPFAIAAPGKTLNITLWTLQVLVALAFVAAAAGKLLGSADMIALFDAVGVGQWFRYVTGLLELLGALLLIVPRTAAFGSVLLAGVMVGAVVAHLT